MTQANEGHGDIANWWTDKSGECTRLKFKDIEGFYGTVYLLSEYNSKHTVSSSPLVVWLDLALITLLVQVYAEGDVGLHEKV